MEAELPGIKKRALENLLPWEAYLNALKSKYLKTPKPLIYIRNKGTGAW